MRTKDEIASATLADTKMRYGDLEPRKAENRRALVIGSNRDHNIGSCIAQNLRNDFIEADEYDIDEVDIRNGHPGGETTLALYDTLIIASGITRMNWIENQSPIDVDDIIETNLLGPIKMTRQFVGATMHKPYYKYIVYIGSMAYKSVLNASAAYCASKAGLNHFARCAAWELAPKGYRVFCVNPSNVEGTPMTEATIQGIMNYRGLRRDEAEAYWGAINLYPRWLQPEHVADVVTALCIDEAMSYMSGAPVDLPAAQR